MTTAAGNAASTEATSPNSGFGSTHRAIPIHADSTKDATGDDNACSATAQMASLR